MNPTKWSEPLHHNPEGRLDPHSYTLKKPFVVLVTGGSDGIGLGCAISFAKAKASHIFISSRSASKLESGKKDILSANPDVKVTTVVSDVTSETDVKTLAELIKQDAGRLDVAILNAGRGPALINRDGKRDFPANFHEAPLDDMKALFELNLLAQWTLCRYMLPLLEETEDGAKTIALISSAAAHYINPNIMAASYSLTKFAATRLVEHVHEAHHKNGINSFAIQPGGVSTTTAMGSLPEGKGWEKLLIDHAELAGGFILWLVNERKDWLSGRYLDARWDVDELERRKERIVSEDLLKFRLAL